MMWLPLIFAWCVTFAQESEQKTFRFEVEVRNVYVDVFVTLDGQPVADLTAEDFEVLDNGIPQQFELLNHNDLPLSTMLLLDVSGSVEGEKLEQLRAAAHAFVEGLEPEDEVGLMTFTREMHLRMPMSTDFASLHRVLLEPMDQGDTSLHDTLYVGLKLVEARGGRPLVVLFTDGLDNMSWLTETEVIEVLKETDVVVYAIAVQSVLEATSRMSGRSVRRNSPLGASVFLQNITKQTGGRVWYIDPGANLKDIFLSVLAEMQNRYLLRYEPRGVPLKGWHDLNVRLKHHQADQIRSRPGYLVRAR